MALLVEEEVIKELETIYSLEDVRKVKRIKSIRNILYDVECKLNRYVFKLSPTLKSDSIQKERLLIQKVSLLGGSVPAPFNSHNENYEIVLNRKCYLAYGYSYINGRTVVPEKTDFIKFGESIARFHNITSTMPKYDWCPLSTIKSLVHSPITEITKVYSNPESAAYLKRFSEWVVPILQEYSDSKLLGVTHGDAHHHNAIIQNSGDVVLIDLEEASWQWRSYDLATAIWGTFGRGGNAHVWNSLLSGYQAHRNLDKDEEGLIKILIAVRHVWWLGFRAHAGGMFHAPDTNVREFFRGGVELLMNITEEICGESLS